MNEEESLILRESQELYELKVKLHKMLKEIIIKTGLGEVEDGYVDDLNLDVGGCSIYSCGYYQQLMLVDEDGVENEFDNDLESVRYLYKEIKKRLAEYDKIIKNKSQKTAVRVFEKALKIKFEIERLEDG